MLRSLTRVLRLRPRILRLTEKLLARAGFPTNASGNNMSSR